MCTFLGGRHNGECLAALDCCGYHAGAIMLPPGDLIGESPQIVAIREQIGRLVPVALPAHPPLPVLIHGESGTGRGFVARLLHALSARGNGPFVDVNCAALLEPSLETELFGSAAGAAGDRGGAPGGLVEAADGGTLFLEDVTLLSETLQEKLIAVIDWCRAGGTGLRQLDVWIVTAANGDVEDAVRSGGLRQDLYDRLSSHIVRMPPLRDRGRDAILLARHFLARACIEFGIAARRLSVEAEVRVLGYPWPGNVRDLANCMERAALLSEGPEVGAITLGLPRLPASGRATVARAQLPAGMTAMLVPEASTSLPANVAAAWSPAAPAPTSSSGVQW